MLLYTKKRHLQWIFHPAGIIHWRSGCKISKNNFLSTTSRGYYNVFAHRYAIRPNCYKWVQRGTVPWWSIKTPSDWRPITGHVCVGIDVCVVCQSKLVIANHNWTSIRPVMVYLRVMSCYSCYMPLTHWGRVPYICVSKSAIIGSDNNLSPLAEPMLGYCYWIHRNKQTKIYIFIQ